MFGTIGVNRRRHFEFEIVWANGTTAVWYVGCGAFALVLDPDKHIFGHNEVASLTIVVLQFRRNASPSRFPSLIFLRIVAGMCCTPATVQSCLACLKSYDLFQLHSVL